MANIMPNPSVEIDSDGDGVPDYWRTIADPGMEAATFIWDVDAYEGARSIAVQVPPNPAAEGYRSCYWMERWNLDAVDCPFKRGETYRYRAAYRSQNCNIRVWCNFRNVAEEYISGAGTGPIRSEAWAQSPWFEFTIPAEAQYIHIGIGVRNEDIDAGVTTAYVWGDAFECETTAPPCESYATQAECEAAGCYWYDSSCHSEPAVGPVRLDLAVTAAAALAVTDAALILYYIATMWH